MACYHPITIKNPYNEKSYMSVPCGKCAACRKKLRDEWFIRLKEEKKVNNARFITLTYNEENIPISIDDDSVIHYNVSKNDLQGFFKRMRKTNKFKYFAVSEYGSEGRPHYHLILFSKKRIDIEKYWKYGFVYDENAGDRSLKYVCKYLLKGSNVPVGSNPNFMICSKRPAIGMDYIKVNDEELDRRISEPIYKINNYNYPLPRYYRKKFYDRLDDKGKERKELLCEEMVENKVNPLWKKFLKKNPGNLDQFKNWCRIQEGKDVQQQKIINNGKTEIY